MICILILLVFFSKTYAQSNITWTIKDKIVKGYIKSHTSFNTSFSGFTNKSEFDKFLSKIKSNPEIASIEIKNSDANGNCDLKLVMKHTHDKIYYIGLAQKLGVSYIVFNNVKKTPQQIMNEKI